MALVGNDSLFQMSFAEYDSFLSQSAVISGTSDARLVTQVGERLRAAAEKWAAAEGQSEYLRDYQWEYKLVKDDQVNAWCMPGGKIVVYTGILPVTKTADGLAVVLGHELAHALLNHGQQRRSAGMLQSVGAVGVQIATANASTSTKKLAEQGYGIGSNVGAILPFSRKHETEADMIGLTLMTIAGYNPDEAPVFWQRMAALGGGVTPELLSTHPSDTTRINNLKNELSSAKEKASKINNRQ